MASPAVQRSSIQRLPTFKDRTTTTTAGNPSSSVPPSSSLGTLFRHRQKPITTPFLSPSPLTVSCDFLKFSGSITTSIMSCTNLLWVLLSNNKLTGDRIGALPAVLRPNHRILAPMRRWLLVIAVVVAADILGFLQDFQIFSDLLDALDKINSHGIDRTSERSCFSRRRMPSWIFSAREATVPEESASEENRVESKSEERNLEEIGSEAKESKGDKEEYGGTDDVIFVHLIKNL
ncbi:hypothetical protein L2E82_31487 [Cichorium intybus]|uniref:Uncharacterized protein n=1 Tax=Cichorium intybus TaxID=13427 RepID=A0ACB9BE65_CICIN|nr:hypothetical protein L2E82_31487 [Cichorium intybus]